MIISKNIKKNNITIKDYLKTENDQIEILQNKNHALYFVNNQRVSNYYVLKKDDLLEIVYLEKPSNIIPIKEQLNIVYEDTYLIVINKPINIATIPTRAHYTNSIANYLAQYYLENGIISTIHFINRLDLPTSGLLIVAKNGYIAGLMSKETIVKKYLLEVRGEIIDDGIIVDCIKKDNQSMKRVIDESDLSNAITKFQVLKSTSEHTLIEATLETGKTHQLRVQFSNLNHPIIGDKLYGTSSDRLHLHSYYLHFKHPITNEILEFIDIPNDFNCSFTQLDLLVRDQSNHNR